MTNLFQRTSSHWVRFSEYELKEAKDGQRYVTPAPKSRPTLYNPLKDAETMVVDALNVGLLSMSRSKDAIIQAGVLDFVSKYGLLGLMTALPTTPHFMDYDAAYLPRNPFVKEESMNVNDYTMLFYPFTKPDFYHTKGELRWDINVDGEMMALAMTFSDGPTALNMSFQREYAERYDWLTAQFKSWSFTFLTSVYYYKDYDGIDETARDLYRKGMAAFGGIAPTYHIALLEKPTIVWDFHSLLLGVQMMFSFMLTDDAKPIRICKHCQKAYAASHPNSVFCSHRCKNQYNVYKSRGKNK